MSTRDLALYSKSKIDIYIILKHSNTTVTSYSSSSLTTTPQLVSAHLRLTRLSSSSTPRLSSYNPPFAWLNALYERTSFLESESEMTNLIRLNCSPQSEDRMPTSMRFSPTGRGNRGYYPVAEL
jgi:hypothetical protein